jgi:glycosyltransferase involved in cell wall biosynthesis
MLNNILLVGTVSNVAKTIEKELKTVVKALRSFDKIEIFLVESDSTDNTVEILKYIQQKNKNFTFVTKGHLSSRYPNRIARIAYCRNIYVQFIKENFEKNQWQYVAVADLDGMNKKLTSNAIDTCFETDIKWDGIMANQKYGYYDIYALRALNWVETDCFSELQKLKNISPNPNVSQNSIVNFLTNFNHFDHLREIAIFSKMKIIARKSPPIKVESAFGGFAIYKSNVFLNSDYESSNYKESEHVEFHRKLTKIGFSFFINPDLINNNFNSYNISKFKAIRFIRELRKIW